MLCSNGNFVYFEGALALFSVVTVVRVSGFL
jgi:hypothetical protein